MDFKHDGFVTTGRRPFRRDSFPMRLYEKAKRLGTWNPSDLDLSVDRASWHSTEIMSDLERDAIIGTVSIFQAGEEAVTTDVLPLISAVAREGRLEEEIFLTTFLFEEAKHTDFFQRWLHEVPGVANTDLQDYHTPSYRTLFYEHLPQRMWALQSDPSPVNQIRASVTYNMVVEGVLAETGYFGFFHFFEENPEQAPMLPGLLEGIRLLRQDESRHIAYGIYLLSRLVAANPELWHELEAEMTLLLPLAMATVGERMDHQIKKWGALPNETDPAIINAYAIGQYQKRYARLERARTQSLQEIEQVAMEIKEDAA